MADPRTKLESLFDADRVLRAAEDAFLDSADEKVLARTISAAVKDALTGNEDGEQEMRLVRLADLAAQVPCLETIEALLKILDHHEPAVRSEAGECLLDVAYERFKEVAVAIEGLLDRRHDGESMEEIPFILAEIRDPDPLPLLVRFLAHPRAEVVASAIEAVTGYGDGSVIRHLEKLTEDPREVTLPDLDDATATVGDLAADAIAELQGDPRDDE